MVHVVEESIYGQGYREINQQLAKENGELRQQLSQAMHEICQQRIEIHKRDVEINQLRGQLKDLNKVHERYRAIREIVDHESTIEVVQAIEQAPSAEKENDENQSRETYPDSYYLVPIAEDPEYEDVEEVTIDDACVHESDRCCSPENDSLEPPEVTSVPPVDYCERTMQTPSIWNCLDTLGSPSSFPNDQQTNQNNNILHSTPVQPVQPPKAAKSKKAKPTPEEEEATGAAPRYNLRKRTKR